MCQLYSKQLLWGGQYDDPNYEGPPFKRSPIVPIYVYQDEHNFVFETTLFGESVEVLRDGNLLFATKIDANGKIIIPTDISGEVELRLIRGSVTYHATVVL